MPQVERTFFNAFCNCPRLTKANMSNIKGSYRYLFINTPLEEVVAYNVTVKGVFAIFQQCTKLKTIEGLNTWDVTNATTLSSLFANCQKLTALDVSSWDVGNVTDLTNFLSNCYELISFKPPFNINVSLGNFSASTGLSSEDLLLVINNLNTVASVQTLTFGNTNLSKLTSGQIKIATDKNWSVV